MTKTPKVIFNSRYILGLNNPDNKFVKKDKCIKKVKDMYDYYSNEEKRAVSMYDYYIGDINKKETMNLVIENGNYVTKEELNKRKKLAVKYLKNSNLWQGVLSFDNDYINNNINIHKLEKELVKTILPKFFKKCGFKDIKNMFYQLSLHTDTDNLHFHFSFMEKSPNYIYSKNKIGYRRSGKLKQSEIDFLKSQVIHVIEKEKTFTPILKEVNNEIDELKKYFNPKEHNFLLNNKKELIYEEKILKLGKLLYDTRINDNKIKFGSITNKEIIRLTTEIKNYIFSKANNNFKTEYSSFKKLLKNINDYFYKLNEDNNVKQIALDTSFTDNKEKYLNNYVCNSIVNHALYNYKKEFKNLKHIKENDIIQSIILKNYINNKKQARIDILKNYFASSNKFKNKKVVEQSIKNINNEMEEAVKEFSKLFINEKCM